MKRVSNLLVGLVAVALLCGVSSKAHAVFGIPDDVPGATLLFPFFKVDPTPTADSQQDTLLAITNTANRDTFVHVTVWDRNSVHVYDFTIDLTEHDVWSCSLLDLLFGPGCPDGVPQAPAGVITSLTVPGEDLLTGYITADVVSTPTFQFPGQAGYPFLNWNTLIGHLYLVNLARGSATGFNAVSLESFPPTQGHPVLPINAPLQTGFYLNRCLDEQNPAACIAYDARERIDGPAGNAVQTLGLINPLNSPLSLIVRYFSATDLEAVSEIFLWKDRVTSGGAADVNVAVYDEEENAHSITLQLPFEVNFAETAQIITPGAPGGWFRIKFECGEFTSCNFVPIVPVVLPLAVTGTAPTIQAHAFSVQNALSSDATLRWDAVFPAHRQYTNYIGGISEE